MIAKYRRSIRVLCPVTLTDEFLAARLKRNEMRYADHIRYLAHLVIIRRITDRRCRDADGVPLKAQYLVRRIERWQNREEREFWGQARQFGSSAPSSTPLLSEEKRKAREAMRRSRSKKDVEEASCFCVIKGSFPGTAIWRGRRMRAPRRKALTALWPC
jgi:hypothetical protein